MAGAFPAVADATVGGAILAGAYVERCSFRPLIRQAPVVAMISSFAVSMQLQELVALGSPSRTIPYPAPAWLPAEARGSPKAISRPCQPALRAPGNFTGQCRPCGQAPPA